MKLTHKISNKCSGIIKIIHTFSKFKIFPIKRCCTECLQKWCKRNFILVFINSYLWTNNNNYKLVNHFCAARLLQLCESLMTSAESCLISIVFTFSCFIGKLSLLTRLMWEMKVGVLFGMLGCDTIEEKSFLFATSLIELKVLLNQGGQLFFAVLSSTSVALSWCVKFYKTIM